MWQSPRMSSRDGIGWWILWWRWPRIALLCLAWVLLLGCIRWKICGLWSRLTIACPRVIWRVWSYSWTRWAGNPHGHHRGIASSGSNGWGYRSDSWDGNFYRSRLNPAGRNALSGSICRREGLRLDGGLILEGWGWGCEGYRGWYSLWIDRMRRDLAGLLFGVGSSEKIIALWIGQLFGVVFAAAWIGIVLIGLGAVGVAPEFWAELVPNLPA